MSCVCSSTMQNYIYNITIEEEPEEDVVGQGHQELVAQIEEETEHQEHLNYCGFD